MSQKPQFLYHGSPHKFEELEPRETHEITKKMVFATSNIAVASMYMLKHVGLTGSFLIDGRAVYYAILFMDREEFLRIDKGGHIYVLPSDTFEPSHYEGMQNEWVSKAKVKPVSVLEYPSALDAVITKYGIQVFFADRSMYEEINKSKDHGWSILKNLGSENQKRRINVFI